MDLCVASSATAISACFILGESDNMYVLYITRIAEQCVQMRAVPIVAKIPKTNPEHLNAYGIDSIPEPSDAFNKWVNVSLSL